MINIAKWVKDARNNAGLSQEALGELLGKTKGNISAWEKGRHEPSYKQIIEIKKITGTPLPDDSQNLDELSVKVAVAFQALSTQKEKNIVLGAVGLFDQILPTGEELPTPILEKNNSSQDENRIREPLEIKKKA